MQQIEKTVENIYNYHFEQAQRELDRLDQKLPQHPVVPLIKALWYYHKYFPLIVDTKGTDTYFSLCEEAKSRCKPYLSANSDDLEGVAFDMIGRAMMNLVYVDNGESMKVASGAPALYRGVSKGFTLMNEYNEFYFTTGLYNYYREAYPDAHPVYKPIAALFPSGSTDKGLAQLRYAADNCIFLKAEAMLFLSLIYNNYENNSPMAEYYATKLHNLYPRNLYFLGEYIESLFINGHYAEAKPSISTLLSSGKDVPFMVMRGLIFKGIYEDRVNHRPEVAKKYLESGLRMTGNFKRYDESAKSMAYFGLSRVYREFGDQNTADKYYRQGKNIALFPFEYKIAE